VRRVRPLNLESVAESLEGTSYLHASTVHGRDVARPEVPEDCLIAVAYLAINDARGVSSRANRLRSRGGQRGRSSEVHTPRATPGDHLHPHLANGPRERASRPRARHGRRGGRICAPNL
jgi:hypothetical protein